MAKSQLPFALLMILSLLTGCFGMKAPDERYLHLSAVQTACGQLGFAEETSPADSGLPILALRPFSAFPALNRSALMLAQGPILRPSLSLSWEAVPADLLTQAMVNALACSDKRTILWPYSGRSPHDAVLMGRVTTFKVDTQASYFFAALHIDLYGPRSKTWLAGKAFLSEQRFRERSAEAYAQAADAAVLDLTSQVLKWLDEHAPLIEAGPSGQ
jgi:ABC-type uncharacterized transport system auxiliary subunit